LKIVIAVICIGFLVYFLVSLYFTNKGSKDLELAEASLNYLIDEINAGATEVEIYNPKGWVISVWPHEISEWKPQFPNVFNNEMVERIPKSCSNVGLEKCICVCKSDNSDECDNNGICLENNLELSIEEDSIKIEEVPFKLEIKDKMIVKK